MESIYAWQERLKRRSLFIIFIVFAYLYTLSTAILLYLGLDLWSSLLLGGLFSLTGTAYNTWRAYNNPQKVVGSITGAVEAKDRRLLSHVEKMKLAYGIRNVEVYEVPWEIINAFVVSSPEKHYLFVTRGAIEKLEDPELENVLAHEFAHMENRDSFYMTLAVVVAGSIVLLSYYVLRVVPPANNRQKGAAIVFFIALILALLSPLVTRVLISALSKEREFLADARAVQVTKYPPGLINALIKVAFENTRKTLEKYQVPKTFGALFFEYEDIETHPPVHERIRRIAELTKTPVDPRILRKLREMGL
ncbi:MAG: M48 family metalloprotease [Candidatus Diapherotrites archaeon]|nr:M48 family metalloprotease [Candidatus Diapherotrites archaeon]